MKRQSLFPLLVILVVLSLVLAACQAPAATEIAAPVEEVPTEAAPVEEPTEVPTEEVAAPVEEPHPLWNAQLKQAFAAAIDREAIVDRVFEGRNIPAYHMIPDGYPFFTEPFLDKYGQRDLDLAIQLLTDLGYTADNKFTFDLWYPPEHYGTTTADVMQIMEEQLEETGLIDVNLQSQNWAEYVDSFVAGKLPVFILGWFPDFVDPETWLAPFATCEQSPGNGVNYCNEDMDALLKAAAAASDVAEREDLYNQAGELYAEEVPTLPLFWEPEFIINRPGVEGIVIGPPFEFNYDVLGFGADAEPASGSPDTIIIGTTDEVNSLDAADAYATHDWEILKNTGASLMAYTPGTADLIPGAAAAAPEVSEDGKTYTFTLRDNLKYADGTAVTSADYIRAWDRLNALDGQVKGLITAYVAGVEATDDLTVVYTLKDAYAFFPALTATPPFIPVPPDYSDTEISQFPTSLNGIGAYQVTSFVPGEQMELSANPNYFGEAPLITNVIIKYFADPTTMANAVENGDIDIAWRTVGPVEAVRLEGVEGLTVTTVNAPALRYLVFNHTYMVGGETE